jgi:SAM-dependent methyltransferase
MSLPTNCPLCEQNHTSQSVLTPHVFGGKKGQSFFRCGNCDAIYQFPKLTAQEEKEFYKKEFESFMTRRAGTEGGWDGPERHIAVNEEQRIRRMKYISPHLKQSSHILEVGCSSGFMLYPLIDDGHVCWGVEPSGVFSEYVKSRGMPCFESMEVLKAESNQDETFDIIMHFFVLEHIANPLDFLTNQLQLLKPGGKLIVEIPNAADPLYTIYDIPEFDKFYWSVAHHWYFTEKSFGYLLGKLGLSYEFVRDQRYDLSNHMIWARDGKPGGMNKYTEFFGQEIENQYKDALIKSGHCDTLVAIISKDT